MRERETCHDCGCKEGEIHEFGCDMEVCPFCGKQLISCDCIYEKLDLFSSSEITNEEEEQWLDILIEKGRRRYIQYPVLCVYCGKLWPDFFYVSDEEWNKYIYPDERREVICEGCWNWIKKIQDESEQEGK